MKKIVQFLLQDNRLFFLGCILGPFSLSFFLPLLLHNPHQGWYFLSTTPIPRYFILKAFILFLFWAMILTSTVLWPITTHKPVPPAEWSHNLIWRIFLVSGLLGPIIGVIHQFFIMPPGIEEIFQKLSFLPLIAVGCGLYLLNNPRNMPFSKIKKMSITLILVICFLVLSFLPLILALIGPFIYGSLAILFYLIQQKYLIKKILLFFLFAIIVAILGIGIKLQIRNTYYDGLFVRSPPSRNIIVKDLLYMRSLTLHPKTVLTTTDNMQKEITDYFNQRHYLTSKVNFKTRVDHLSELATVLSQTPNPLPFVYGKTYYPILFIPIPRFIWPDKPNDHTGQWFGHRYNFIGPTDHLTSQNLPIITEGWINFGWYGIILSAFFLGLFLRYLWLYFVRNNTTLRGGIFGMLIIYIAANLESSLFLLVGGIIHLLMIYWPIDILLRYWDKKHQGKI